MSLDPSHGPSTPEDRDPANRPADPRMTGDPGPSSTPPRIESPSSTESRSLSTSTSAAPTRLKRKAKRAVAPLVRLAARPWTIKDTPEDRGDDRAVTESTLVGWTGSVIVHALLVLLFLLLAFAITGPEPPTRFDTSIGSTMGEEEGLDLEGGFNDELAPPIEMDPTALSTERLLEPTEPTLQLDPQAILSDAVSPQIGETTGAGGGEFGVARFGEGLEEIRGVEIKVGDPQFTLIWNTRADIDLHVIEPGGSHIYWADRHGGRGGELDVDDVNGFGPENIYWPEAVGQNGQVVKGQGPDGLYHWYVHYYGGFGGQAVPTRWKVRVKHAGQVKVYEGVLRRIGQRGDVQSLRVGDDSAENQPPRSFPDAS